VNANHHVSFFRHFGQKKFVRIIPSVIGSMLQEASSIATFRTFLLEADLHSSWLTMTAPLIASALRFLTEGCGTLVGLAARERFASGRSWMSSGKVPAAGSSGMGVTPGFASLGLVPVFNSAELFWFRR